VLDDAHQNVSVQKAVSLVVVDSETGFGNGRVLPAGPMREPSAMGLARADALVLIGTGDFRVLETECTVLRAKFAPVYAGMNLAGRRLFAFAGIARPEKFFDTLRELGGRLVRTEAFPDHCPYPMLTVQRMIRDASLLDATLVTTEKDYVRLPPNRRSGIVMQKVRLQFEDEGQLDAVLKPAVDRMSAGASS